MSTETHPWTFVDPVCGDPAFHRIGIPRQGERIIPFDHENLDGSPMEVNAVFACQSCGRNIIHWEEGQRLLDPANWVERSPD